MTIRLDSPNGHAQHAHMQDGDILVLMCGGTIDSKPYMHTPEYQKNGKAPPYIKPLRHSRVPKALADMGLAHHCECVQMEMKDSQHVSDEDIEKIARRIRDARQHRVIVTFGTDVMADAARVMVQKLAELDVTNKTVIFTGAMEPLKHGREVSDGFGNLAFAVEAASYSRLPPDVYVAMRDRNNDHKLFTIDHELHKKTVLQENGRFKKYFVGNPVRVQIPAPAMAWR